MQDSCGTNNCILYLVLRKIIYIRYIVNTSTFSSSCPKKRYPISVSHDSFSCTSKKIHNVLLPIYSIKPFCNTLDISSASGSIDHWDIQAIISRAPKMLSEVLLRQKYQYLVNFKKYSGILLIQQLHPSDSMENSKERFFGDNKSL